MTENQARYQSGGRFTSREAWIHPTSTVPTYELIVVVEGEVWLEENGCEFFLPAGTAILLDAGKRHGGIRYSQERVSFYWIHFFEGERERAHIPKTVALQEPYAVTILCRQLLFYAERGFDQTALDAFLHILLLELADQSKRVGEGGALAARIREWIRINSDRMIGVRDVSAQFGYNVDYLSRIYRKSYGRGLKAEIDRMKLAEIKRLLTETDWTLARIATAVGMQDYKLFLKFFRYHEEITPTEFRKLYPSVPSNNR